MEAIPLCTSCISVTNQDAEKLKPVDENYKCSLCFGILSDNEFRLRVAKAVGEQFESSGYDGNSVIVAVNVPVSLVLREYLFAGIVGNTYSPREMSSKNLFATLLQKDIERVRDIFKLIVIFMKQLKFM